MYRYVHVIYEIIVVSVKRGFGVLAFKVVYGLYGGSDLAYWFKIYSYIIPWIEKQS